MLKENGIELRILYPSKLSIKYEERYKDIFRYSRIQSLTEMHPFLEDNLRYTLQQNERKIKKENLMGSKKQWKQPRKVVKGSSRMIVVSQAKGTAVPDWNTRRT